MKLSALVLLATIGLVAPVNSTYAQTAPGPDAPAAAPPPAPGPDAGPPPEDGAPGGGGGGKMKALREACRDQIKGQGLKGEERMKAVDACILKERPDLAQRLQCREQGWEKGLRKDDLHGFVKDCLKGKA